MMTFLKQLGAGCLAETDGPLCSWSRQREAKSKLPLTVVVDATAHVKRERRKKVSAASSPCLSLPYLALLTQHACTSQLPSIHPIASTTWMHVRVEAACSAHVQAASSPLRRSPPAICACHCHLSTKLKNKHACCNLIFYFFILPGNQGKD